MKNKSIEDLFKDSFENFEADVNPNVWKNIQADLKVGESKTIARFRLGKLGVAAILTFIIAILGIVVLLDLKYSDSKCLTKDNKMPTSSHVSSQQISKNKLTSPGSEEIQKTTTSIPSKNDNAIVSAVQKSNDLNSNKNINGETSPDQPIAMIYASSMGETTAPVFLNLSNKGNGKINKWTFNDGKSDIISNNPIHVFESPGVYTIKLTSTTADGKVAIDSVEVEVMASASPSGIVSEVTSNGVEIGSKDIVSMRVLIVDKLGNKIFTYEGTQTKWDGKNSNGRKVKPGLYFYFISAKEGDGNIKELKGIIKLKG